jgi:hypothetical protein
MALHEACVAAPAYNERASNGPHALPVSASAVRLGQDRPNNVLESRTGRVSEGALCGLQHILSTGKIVPFLAD